MQKKKTTLAQQIGKRIMERRKELGLTQEEAAARAGLSHQFFACVERGIKGMGAESIIKICQALEISADYLLTGKITVDKTCHFQSLISQLNETQRNAAKEIIKNLLIACGYTIE